MTSEVPSDPLYYQQITPNGIWPTRIYQSMAKINSAPVCTALCTLTDANCQLAVYDATGLTCFFGNFATASAVFAAPAGTTSATVYTRINKISKY